MQSVSEGVRLSIHVKTLSRETKLIREPDGTLTMHVAAPPVKGRANREIVKWLAKKLRKPTSNVRLVSGLHSDVKVILITGMAQTEVAARLAMPLSRA
jgi:uncharacterized protein (TIGR00251 family)